MNKINLTESQCYACGVASSSLSLLLHLDLPSDIKSKIMDFSGYLEELAFSKGGFSCSLDILENGDFEYSYSFPEKDNDRLGVRSVRLRADGRTVCGHYLT